MPYFECFNGMAAIYYPDVQLDDLPWDEQDQARADASEWEGMQSHE